MKIDTLEDVQPIINAEIVLRKSNKLTGSSGQHFWHQKIQTLTMKLRVIGVSSSTKRPHRMRMLTWVVLVPAGDVPQAKKKGSFQVGLTSGKRTKHTIYVKRKSERGSRKNEYTSNCDAESKF